ncbi:MAG: hypothetical protein P2A85_12520 [Microcoleus anatoxicus]|uniref:hypothetical protein n=1 Tax=Microcoleus anatoxicus TaxID=2705319 RepID=UPI0036709163
MQDKEVEYVFIRASPPALVYKKAELALLPPLDFELANGSKLSADNRWVKMAQIIPWSEFESEYAANFPADS